MSDYPEMTSTVRVGCSTLPPRTEKASAHLQPWPCDSGDDQEAGFSHLMESWLFTRLMTHRSSWIHITVLWVKCHNPHFYRWENLDAGELALLRSQSYYWMERIFQLRFAWPTPQGAIQKPKACYHCDHSEHIKHGGHISTWLLLLMPEPFCSTLARAEPWMLLCPSTGCRNRCIRDIPYTQPIRNPTWTISACERP